MSKTLSTAVIGESRTPVWKVLAGWVLVAASTAPSAVPAKAGDEDLRTAVDRVDASERVLMQVTERVLDLRSGLSRLELPGAASRTLFADVVEVVDLGAAEAVPGELPSYLGIARRRWRVADEPERRRRSRLRLWRPLLGRLASVERVAIGTVDGDFGDPSGSVFRSRHEIRLRGRGAGGEIVFLTGEVELEWRDEAIEAADAESSDAPDWRITSWRSRPVDEQTADRLLFEESLADMLPAAALARARRSIHEEHVIAFLGHPQAFRPPHPQFDTVSHDRHPAVSVVDVDGDGWDDLYVMARWGPNMLLRNRGRGADGRVTFEEVAAELGLDVADHTSCAVFADFDNDGDADVFLGRTLARSLLLFQEDGLFVERPGASAGPLPMLVASASAADYDGDGLLDLYVATYSKRAARHLTGRAALALDPELPLPDGVTWAAMERDSHRFLNVWGPANVLLRNVGGGRFVDATRDAGLLTWRHTYQATWSDYDQDGDPDLYLANDYAPNNLFRNRGRDADGRVRFEDVTAATGTADPGFGMGASWGDYDNDGWLDLYVSNMFSKAGTRITGRLPALDAGFAKMARGNTLLRNRGGSFTVVSGSEAPALQVERTGWSWGGQFLDVDNDGWLDLVVANGYYSVPEPVSLLPVDT
ncbi:MAG: VCBS repeat-containing protein [Thermoanaerobaculia bacterium]